MASRPSAQFRPPRFSLRQARAFLYVADELHFGRAANWLFTTQPALSRSIRALEEAVGATPLERSTRRVRLSPVGEAFSAECRLALGHLERATNVARNAAAGRAGRLRVTYMDFAINGRLPQILQRFRAKFPQVLIHLEYMPAAQQRIALVEGRIDVGFVIGEVKGQNIHNDLVDEEDFVALLPAAHRLASRSHLRLADLAEEPFVIGSEDTFSSFRVLVFQLCRNAGFFSDIVQEVSNSNGIFGLVAAAAGVTLYAGRARNIQRAGVVVKRLTDIEQRIPIVTASLLESPSDALRRFPSALLSNSPAAHGTPQAKQPRRGACLNAARRLPCRGAREQKHVAWIPRPCQAAVIK